MNFFQAQDKARRKTGHLALMFGAAVITLVVLTNLMVAMALGWVGSRSGLTFSQSIANIPADSWLWVTIGVIGIVGVASAYKYVTISAGGRTIAEALGGSLVLQSTPHADQRRLLNVVEEMALASGVPVPPVYLIPEPSINAFAAGFGADDAVMGINQGTLDNLTRAELQGVVAHEFSHILNGDTSINLRLIAILHGILFLGMIGYGVMRAGGYSRRDGMPLIVVGIGLLIIGYGGTFFGNLIKAAVSRQREYLADASAVQFTRDNTGIADALKKIGGLSVGSTMVSPAADQASHMFFGASAVKYASSMMATHPPLEERIRAIEPQWDGRFTYTGRGHGIEGRGQPIGTAGFAGAASAAIANVTPDSIVERVGNLSTTTLNAAQHLIIDNDTSLTDAAHDPFEARALIYAMLIDANPELEQRQLQLIQSQADRGVPDNVARLLPLVRMSDHQHRLTLVEMSMPALKELSYPQYQRFSQNTVQLIGADNRVEVFEWVLHRMLMKELYPHFEGPQNYHGRISKIQKVAAEASLLLSILASHGGKDDAQQRQAYQAGAEELGIDQPFSPQTEFDYQRLNAALAKLRKLKPLVKPGLLKACATTVLADESLNSSESALLHGIAATLDCPLPPRIRR